MTVAYRERQTCRRELRTADGAHLPGRSRGPRGPDVPGAPRECRPRTAALHPPACPAAGTTTGSSRRPAGQSRHRAAPVPPALVGMWIVFALATQSAGGAIGVPTVVLAGGPCLHVAVPAAVRRAKPANRIRNRPLVLVKSESDGCRRPRRRTVTDDPNPLSPDEPAAARLRRLTGSHRPFLAVLAVAAALRVIVTLGYPPAMFFNDSYNYITDSVFRVSGHRPVQRVPVLPRRAAARRTASPWSPRCRR